MLPLHNKTVLVTRADEQSSDFTNQLEALGAKTISLPLIKTSPTNQQELQKAITETAFDWIIFTSANAVKYFYETIDNQLVKGKIATVGSKTATTVKEHGATVSFSPSKFTAVHLANELPIKEGDKILIPRSNLAKNNLVELLTARGCEVTPLSIYENTFVAYTQAELDAIFNQAIDFITFTSGSTVEALCQLGIPITQQKIVCIGPVTARIAEKNGLKVSSIAEPHTIEGMIASIQKA